jgi:hypothetical protein
MDMTQIGGLSLFIPGMMAQKTMKPIRRWELALMIDSCMMIPFIGDLVMAYERVDGQ